MAHEDRATNIVHYGFQLKSSILKSYCCVVDDLYGDHDD